jgi:hypothetical protein
MKRLLLGWALGFLVIFFVIINPFILSEYIFDELPYLFSFELARGVYEMEIIKSPT